MMYRSRPRPIRRSARRLLQGILMVYTAIVYSKTSVANLPCKVSSASRVVAAVSSRWPLSLNMSTIFSLTPAAIFAEPQTKNWIETVRHQQLHSIIFTYFATSVVGRFDLRTIKPDTARKTVNCSPHRVCIDSLLDILASSRLFRGLRECRPDVYDAYFLPFLQIGIRVDEVFGRGAATEEQ